MRVLVHEYLSTGALAGRPGADSLAREGLAMLGAVLADLSACRGVEVVTLAAPGLVGAVRQSAPAAEVHPVGPGDEEPAFRWLARRCDSALVIAPEFDDLLARRAEWALEEGCRLLGPTPPGIRLTADKLRLAQHWQAHGVPTPATAPCAPGPRPFAVSLVKPRFGAGCQGTFLARAQEQYERVAAPGLVVQPYFSGVPASVSFLVGRAGRLPLLPAEQAVTYNTPGRQLRYQGGALPLGEEYRRPAIDLADRALAVAAGLQGYVGVDLVLDPDRRQPRDLAIEINPRLTTSYVGLRRLARFNVMQAMLDVLEGKSPGPLQYEPGRVRFLPDGSFT
jgi:predicted ATP-grasp superfamily ATP-dependent carboligase